MTWKQRIEAAKKAGNKFNNDDVKAATFSLTSRVGETQKHLIDPITNGVKIDSKYRVLDCLDMAFWAAVRTNKMDQVERLYGLIKEYPLLGNNAYEAAKNADKHWLGKLLGDAKVMTKVD